MKALIAGTDEYAIEAPIRAEGHDVTTVEIGDSDSLEAAGIAAADVYLLTEMSQATSIAIAKEHNPDVRVVVYAEGSLPEFATPQADLVVDPALLDPATVAEELD